MAAIREEPVRGETAGRRVRPVPAVTRAVAILRLLGRGEEALGVHAIARALTLIPSTCLHILRVLVAEGATSLPAAAPGLVHYELARLTRTANQANITADMITDRRQKRPVSSSPMWFWLFQSQTTWSLGLT